MMEIKRVCCISAKVSARFTDYARKEWKAMRHLRGYVYSRAKGLWVLRIAGEPLCVIGLIMNSLVGSGIEVFFLMCEAAHKNLKALVRFLRKAFRRVAKLYSMITVSIDTAHPEGRMFVKFFGFRPVPHLFTEGSTTFQNYELRASWL